MAGEQTDYRLLRAHELVNALWNDAELGSKIREKAKAKFPDITLPEEGMVPVTKPLTDKIAVLEETIAQLKSENEDQKKARADAEMKRGLEEALDKARRNYNLTDEGFDKMVARMKETGNLTDADAAAAWVAQQTPPPKAPGPVWGAQALDLFGSKNEDEKWKTLHRDPVKYMDDELSEFVRDPDKYVRETLGA